MLILTKAELNWDFSKDFMFMVFVGEKLNLMEEEKHRRVYFHFKTFIDFKSKSTGNR